MAGVEKLTELQFFLVPHYLFQGGKAKQAWVHTMPQFHDLSVKLQRDAAKGLDAQFVDFSGLFAIVSPQGEIVHVNKSCSVLKDAKRQLEGMELGFEAYALRVYSSQDKDRLLAKYYKSIDLEGRTAFNLIKEMIGFKKWLMQINLAPSSARQYISYVNKFLSESNNEITSRSVSLFVSNHPRYYVRTALKYFLEYKGLTDEVKIFVGYRGLKEPPIKLKHETDWVEMSTFLDGLKNLKFKKTRKDGDERFSSDAYWAAKLMFYTGARVHEPLGLKVDNIDALNESRLEDLLVMQIKGGNYRRGVIPKDEAQELVRYLRDEKGTLSGEYFFYNDSKTREAAYVRLRRDFYKAYADINPKVAETITHTHNFRRAVTNWLIERLEGNVLAVKEFRGDISITTTMRYIDAVRKKKEEKVGQAEVMKGYDELRKAQEQQ